MSKSLEDIFTSLQNLCKKNERLSVCEVKEHFEARGFGPLLLILALMILLPIGGIPGIPSLCGIITIFISAQMLMGKTSPWLPDVIECRSIKASTLNKGTDKMIGYAKKIDGWSESRLTFLTGDSARKVIAVFSMALGAITIPLEAVPLATAIPAAALFFIGLGATMRDGLIIAIGIALTVVTFTAFTASYFLLAAR